MKNPKVFATDIIELVLKRLKYGRRRQKSVRVVRFQPKAVDALGLDDLGESVRCAYEVRFVGSRTLLLAVINSYESFKQLQRRLKELGIFIPLLIDNGRTTVDELEKQAIRSFMCAFRYIRRSLHRQHVRPKRSTDNFINRQQAFC